MRIRVYLESPYAANESATVEDHVRYAQRCAHDSLRRNEAPFISHLLYTQPGILDDLIPEERTAGIEAGFLWGRLADKTVMYLDYGISRGMQLGIDAAFESHRPVEFRKIGKNE